MAEAATVVARADRRSSAPARPRNARGHRRRPRSSSSPASAITRPRCVRSPPRRASSPRRSTTGIPRRRRSWSTFRTTSWTGSPRSSRRRWPRRSVPALKLAAAVREHVVFHGLHPRAAFVTDSEIRALRPDAREAPHRPARRLPGHLHRLRPRRRARRLAPGLEPEGRDVLDAPRLHGRRALVRPGGATRPRRGRGPSGRAGPRVARRRARADRRGDRDEPDQAARTARERDDRRGRAVRPDPDPLRAGAGHRLLHEARPRGRLRAEPPQRPRLPRGHGRGARRGPAVGALRAGHRHGPHDGGRLRLSPGCSTSSIGTRWATPGSSAASQIITALHLALAKYKGWVSFYGPNFMRFTRKKTRRSRRRPRSGSIARFSPSRWAACSRTPRTPTCSPSARARSRRRSWVGASRSCARASAPRMRSTRTAAS